MPIYGYFLLTLAIEMPMVLLWLKQEWKDALIVGFLLNLFTWPTLVWLMYHTSIDINVLEVGVALTEALGFWLFFKRKWWHCLLAGILFNGVSYGLGLILFSR